jgi:NAD(P)H-hydrate epimerase
MTTALDLNDLGTDDIADVEAAALRLGVTREMLTEAAARSASVLARRLVNNQLDDEPVVALVGTGVKGAVALHTLRVLNGFGAVCTAVLTGSEQQMRPETVAAAELCEKLRFRLLQPRSPAVRGAIADAALLIDGLVGVGLEGAPREPHATLIRLSNEIHRNVLSLECPSGLDPDSGEPTKPTLKARATLSLGLPPAGNFSSLAWQYTGELWLCDIGYPLEAGNECDIDLEGVFAESDLVRIR